MATFSQKFIALSLEQAALRFGSFTLKSGRTSPYFFNAGAFQTGSALSRLGHLYAECIMAAEIDFDVLFGPAYKGIPLVAATACALADSHGRDLPWAFNRKEAKTHGEGGCFVGAGLEGKSVLILDDVITAGTAIRDVMGQLQQVGARPAGVVVALDRAEKGPDSDRSAIQAVRDAFGIPVFSIARLDDLLAWVAADTRLLEFREAMQAYRNQWGVDECT